MNGACCAHSRVTYQPREHPAGGVTSCWLCVDCSLEFVPKVSAVEVLPPDPLETAGRAIYYAMRLGDLRRADANTVVYVDVAPEQWPAPPRPQFEIDAEAAFKAEFADLAGIHEDSRGVTSGRALHELAMAPSIFRPAGPRTEPEGEVVTIPVSSRTAKAISREAAYAMGKPHKPKP